MNRIKISGAQFLDIFSSLLLLFFIDQITLLVESIYMLNLLNTQLDIRVFGMLFLISPVFILFLKPTKRTYVILVLGMLACMILSPLFPSAQRIIPSGVGAGMFLLFFGFFICDKRNLQINWGQSAALATLVSILFRVYGDTLDVSIFGNTIFISWILVGIAGFMFWKIIQSGSYRKPQTHEQIQPTAKASSGSDVFLKGLGVFGSFTLIYFVFSSPGILARWTEGNYTYINIILSIAILVVVFIVKPDFILSKKFKLILLIWNAVFMILLITNILMHRIDFPTIENITMVIVEESYESGAFITYLMLILSPVLFINISWFTYTLAGINSTKIAGSFIAGVFLMISCIFILIFTNTWGYVGDISRIFRNKFYLPFLLAGITLVLPFFKSVNSSPVQDLAKRQGNLTKLCAVLLVLGICGFFIPDLKTNAPLSREFQKEIKLMTYNIQQGVDFFGNKNFEGQLKIIKEIAPDILCLQESDASRISGGNSDIVRYFTRKLGYYSYYGPKTVTGTYGTAILSRFPLENSRTVYTYSSQDEIGTALSEVSAFGQKILIINSHPAGNELAREEHINMVIEQAARYDHVMAMGDYNFRQDSPYYKKIASALTDSWLNLYPDAVGAVDESKLDLSFTERKRSSGDLLGNGQIDMTSRIDHIFLSASFEVVKAHYLPAPESETDHPLYWVKVSLTN